MTERPVERMLKALKPNEKDSKLSNRKRKMIIDLARQELKKRQKEFLAEVRKHTYVEIISSDHTGIYVKLPGSGRIAEIHLYSHPELSEKLYISKINVGKYEAKKDALRGLGIASYLILRAKEYALRQGYPGLTLDCEKELIGFYKKLGFKVMKRRPHKQNKTMFEMDFDFPKK